jgi:DNA-binding XRE family transcriptional regulator
MPLKSLDTRQRRSYIPDQKGGDTLARIAEKYPATVGEKIAAARILKGVSQTELARALQVQRQTVSNWEAGANAPSLKRLRQIASLLGMQTADLV